MIFVDADKDAPMLFSLAVLALRSGSAKVSTQQLCTAMPIVHASL